MRVEKQTSIEGGKLSQIIMSDLRSKLGQNKQHHDRNRTNDHYQGNLLLLVYLFRLERDNSEKMRDLTEKFEIQGWFCQNFLDFLLGFSIPKNFTMGKKPKKKTGENVFMLASSISLVNKIDGIRSINCKIDP